MTHSLFNDLEMNYIFVFPENQTKSFTIISIMRKVYWKLSAEKKFISFPKIKFSSTYRKNYNPVHPNNPLDSGENCEQTLNYNPVLWSSIKIQLLVEL